MVTRAKNKKKKKKTQKKNLKRHLHGQWQDFKIHINVPLMHLCQKLLKWFCSAEENGCQSYEGLIKVEGKKPLKDRISR